MAPPHDLREAIRDRLDELRSEPTCDVETAAGLLGISRGLAYQEAAKGSLAGVPVLRVGHRLRVVVVPLIELLGYSVDGAGQTTATPDERNAP